MVSNDRLESGTVSREMLESLEQSFQQFQARADKLAAAYTTMRQDFCNVNLELDRTNRELAESLARQEETQTYLNSILESMNNGVVGVDITGTITQFNTAAARITGYTPDAVLGKGYGEVLGEESDAAMSVLHVLRTGRGHQRQEKTIWHNDGHPVPVSFQSALLRDQSNRILGAVEIFTDMSRIKELEKEMQRTRTMAALGEMAATVAHEIRNPLGAMGVWAGLLERDFDPADSRRETVRKLIDALSRLNKIVSNLLVYTRPVNSTFRPVSMRDLVGETLDFIQIEVDRLGRNIRIDRNWDPAYEATIDGDPEKLQQALMNLCLNAVQAMPEQGLLSVHIDSPGPASEYIPLRITDTGHGIEEGRLSKIFDPFHTTKENGTGLGLAIVRKFIEHHSGYITAKSRLNEGTSFSVFLPQTKRKE
ncbi:MAG: PAS domain S-box protein [Chitinivibrionales bacterium]|nr:PAS domain S-box protein [Chitinivibrionales bacterium]MBD3357805.1 PAS domain S-box protein [Chitinivibrionales bacterium]